VCREASCGDAGDSGDNSATAPACAVLACYPVLGTDTAEWPLYCAKPPERWPPTAPSSPGSSTTWFSDFSTNPGLARSAPPRPSCLVFPCRTLSQRRRLCQARWHQPGRGLQRPDHPPPLNRGGDRTLNKAIHIIATTRTRTDPATQAYLAHRRTEGKKRPRNPPLPQALHRPATVSRPHSGHDYSNQHLMPAHRDSHHRRNRTKRS